MNEATQILSEVKKAVSGKDGILAWVLAAILAQGHILLEDVPGVGKTTMALAFSRAMGLDCGRVQFTPDVLPSDITGYCVYNKQTGEMVYQPGAVLCNLFLADELNRATSRTQSALLEAMEEGQVTVDGTTHQLPQPFFVIATQNPTGAAGTQLLPDSQLDRFTVRLSLGYPDEAAERELVRARRTGDPLERIVPVVTRTQLCRMQQETAAVFVKDEIIDYIVRLVRATRTHRLLLRGASPRATLSVTAMARAVAYLKGRDFVIPADVSAVFVDTVAHRLLPAPEAGSMHVLLDDLLRQTPAPRWAGA